MNEDCKNALNLWKREITLSKCLTSYEIIDNVIDFERDKNFDNDENNILCEECLSEFCFGLLDWKHSCGDRGGILDKSLPLKYEELLGYA